MNALINPGEEARLGFAREVRRGLSASPRSLPARYFYDALGSALFEAICRLPWYGITRAEEGLLVAHAAEVFRRLQPLSTIVELGSGSGGKLRTFIVSGCPTAATLQVHLVDVSPTALEGAVRAISSLEQVRPVTHEAAYETGLHEAARGRRSNGRALVLFLGSNIGNFDPPGANAFVRGIRAELREGDALLLGADLIKPERDLLLAYDDPLGVTAAFNRNLLVRINRELDGDFDLDRFAHRAIWNAAESRIEMHLVSRSAQRIRIAAAELEFNMVDGELIWTESSYKYRLDDINRLLEPAGFRTAAQWIDRQNGFALTLAEAV